jgi:hypothetical protein
MITINEKNYELKYSLRSMFAWETITGRPFEISTLMDTYIFFYCCIISESNNPQLEFDEFIAACDENPSLMTEFNSFVQKEMDRRSLMAGDKKKVTRKKGKN